MSVTVYLLVALVRSVHQRSNSWRIFASKVSRMKAKKWARHFVCHSCMPHVIMSRHSEYTLVMIHMYYPAKRACFNLMNNAKDRLCQKLCRFRILLSTRELSTRLLAETKLAKQVLKWFHLHFHIGYNCCDVTSLLFCETGSKPVQNTAWSTILGHAQQPPPPPRFW